MIIISQDKKIILNFCNIQNIRIERYTTHEKGKYAYKIFAGNFEGYATEIGTYKTEERAKEILQEIKKCYSSYLQLNGGPAILQGQMDIQPNIFHIPKVYEMPKD